VSAPRSSPAVFASPPDFALYGYYSIDRNDERPLYQFRGRIRADGTTPYLPEAGRYHLYLAIGCPWSQKARITVQLLGLSGVISYSLVDDLRDGRGWAFRQARGPDPINGFKTLKQAYLATDPTFQGHVNAPTLWDRKLGRVVNNENDDIVIDIMTQFGRFKSGDIDLYPPELQGQIDSLSARIGELLNIGVYMISFAPTQSEYDTRVRQLFELLDELDARLADRRYLFGDAMTESDVRLWVSLARFDVAYNPLFRVNLRRLVDYANLWAYARDLYALPAYRELTDFDAFKRVYYQTFPALNPSGLIPLGPLVDWHEPQHRAQIQSAKTTAGEN
jgi:putative glutathione S-transferase